MYGLNYNEHLLTLLSFASGCVSTSVFASLVGIPVDISRSAVGLKTYAITVGMWKYKSIIKTKRKKCDQKTLLAKSMLNNIEILISTVLINLHVAMMNFFSKQNVMRVWRYERRNQKYSIFLFIEKTYWILRCVIAKDPKLSKSKKLVGFYRTWEKLLFHLLLLFVKLLVPKPN